MLSPLAAHALSALALQGLRASTASGDTTAPAEATAGAATEAALVNAFAAAMHSAASASQGSNPAPVPSVASTGGAPISATQAAQQAAQQTLTSTPAHGTDTAQSWAVNVPGTSDTALSLSATRPAGQPGWVLDITAAPTQVGALQAQAAGLNQRLHARELAPLQLRVLGHRETPLPEPQARHRPPRRQR